MLDDETCDYCGGYIDAMNSDAISRWVNGKWRLWCDIEHVQKWVAHELEKRDGAT